MKNKLLPLLFILGSYSAYSQVVVGKKEPNPSAQLEVFANDKGMLIPRVELTGSTDITTIKSGNANSLLVFNTASVSDVKPGYYYWLDTDKKWFKIAVSGEASGIAGINGAPGVNGVNAPAGATMVIDATTGIVYILKPGADPSLPDSWIPINGKNGNNGKDGIAGGSGAPGAEGTAAIDPTIQMYIDYNTGIVYVRDPKDGSKWIPLSGNTGATGINGVPGKDGVSIPGGATLVIDNTTGIIYILKPGADPSLPDSWIPINGKNGNNGKDGIAGGSGAPGAEGTAAIDPTIQMYIDYNTGIVYVRDPKDGSKWIPLTGNTGATGINGVPGKDGVNIPGGATLVIDNTTGIVYILKPGADPSLPDSWIPINGKNGNNGKDGIIGIKGDPGDDGVVIPVEATILINELGVVFIKDPTTGKWIKISGNNGVDGAAGLAGGPGIPGVDGVTAPVGTTVWIDTTTGYVYVKDADGKWVKVSGRDGVDGAAGLAGGPGIPGVNGVSAPAGTTAWIDTTTGIIYIKDANGNWTKISGGDGISSITPIVTVGNTIATYNDASGISAEIKETSTSLILNPTLKTLTYNGEGEVSIIKLADITTTTSEKVLVVTGTAATLADATINIVPSTVVGEVLTTTDTGIVGWKAAVKSNIMEIKVINDDYTLIDDDYTIIAEDLTKDITVTLPDPALNKGRMLIINQFNVLKEDGITPVKVNFNYNVLYSSKAKYSYMAASIFGGLTGGSMKITLQSNGVSWYVITYSM